MTASAYVAALKDGAQLGRPPYIPLLGAIVPRLAQVPEDRFAGDPTAHASALDEVATALAADVITVGLWTDPVVGTDVVRRLQPLLRGRGVAACLPALNPGHARAYCEAGAELLFLTDPDCSDPRPFRTVANIASFYKVPVLLTGGSDDPAATAMELGLDGAVVDRPTGSEPGIIGGGLDLDRDAGGLEPPRATSFFWTFEGEVPPDASAEELVALGRRLHD